jgi:hypothetical protein
MAGKILLGTEGRFWYTVWYRHFVPKHLFLCVILNTARWGIAVTPLLLNRCSPAQAEGVIQKTHIQALTSSERRATIS